MNAHITEHDLLALIEGELPAHRVPEVRAAMESDPALRARVERMIMDRNRLRDLAREHAVRAPSGVLEDAMNVAARSALLDEDPEKVQRRRSRRVQMAVAAGIGVVLIGAWGGAMWWYLGAGAEDRRSQGVMASGERIESATMKPAPGPDATVAEEEMIAESTPAEPNELDESVIEAHRESWDRIEMGEKVDDRDDLLEAFLAAAEADGGSEPEEHDRTDAIFVTPSEAVPMLLAGRVRLYVNGRARPMAYASESGEPGPTVEAPGRVTVELDVSDPESYSDSLSKAIAELEAQVGRPVRLEVVEDREAERENVHARLGFDDVFWWLTEPETWGHPLVITLPIRYELPERPDEMTGADG